VTEALSLINQSRRNHAQDKMADFSQWQKSLRRSTGEILPKAVMPRTRRLKSIHEEVFDENDHVAIIKNAVKNGVQPRRRLSTRGSLSEVPINDKPRQSSVTRSPAKKDKTKSFLTKLPPCNLTIDKNAKIPKEPIPSPIPLPAGVTSTHLAFVLQKIITAALICTYFFRY
jgi:hypothetical protein